MKKIIKIYQYVKILI